MVETELEEIERDWRGISSQREEFCTMCRDGWELYEKEPVQHPGDPYVLHHHVAPWDYEYSGLDDGYLDDGYTWPDPRPDIKKLIEEVRRLKGVLEEDGL